jgi:hypothetical protein
MARLLIHVEGQTEEGFVNEALRDHLAAKGYHAVEARIVGKARVRQRRGGIRAWPSVRMEIVRHLKEDPVVWRLPWSITTACRREKAGLGLGAQGPRRCLRLRRRGVWRTLSWPI